MWGITVLYGLGQVLIIEVLGLSGIMTKGSYYQPVYRSYEEPTEAWFGMFA